MTELMEAITAVPVITVLCLLGAQAVKSWTPLDNKHLPAICGGLGLILGIVAFFSTPGYLPADNALVAAAIGAVSGWAATGIHQTKKQEASG